MRAEFGDRLVINDAVDTEGDLEVIEILAEQVDSEGNTIVDHSVFVVDAHGTVVGGDEIITFETPDGEVIMSQLGDDGDMHLVDRSQRPGTGSSS